VAVNSATHVVSAHEINLILYIEVNHSNDTVRTEKAIDRVDGRVELGNHGKSIAHGDEFSTTGVGVLIEIAYSLTLRYDLLALVGLWFVFMETEGAGILADHLDIGPSETRETLAGHVAETWREVDDI
jgi:hypothetical protein